MSKIQEAGRSMLEMIGVIVLMLVLLLMSLLGFRTASLSSRTKTLTKEISFAVTERRYLNAQGGSTKAHTLTTKVGTTKMVVENKTTGEEAGNFTVTVLEQSKEMCEELKKYHVFVPYKIEVNGTPAGECAEKENDITFYFKEKGSHRGNPTEGGNSSSQPEGGENPNIPTLDGEEDPTTKNDCDDVPYTETCSRSTWDEKGCLTNKRIFCKSNQVCIGGVCTDCPSNDTAPTDENKVCWRSGKKEVPRGCGEAIAWTAADKVLDACHECIGGVKTTSPDGSNKQADGKCCVGGSLAYHALYCPEQSPSDCTACQSYNATTGKCQEDADKLCGGVCCEAGTLCCKDKGSCVGPALNTCVECEKTTDCPEGKECGANHQCECANKTCTDIARVVNPKTCSCVCDANVYKEENGQCVCKDEVIIPQYGIFAQTTACYAIKEIARLGPYACNYDIYVKGHIDDTFLVKSTSGQIVCNPNNKQHHMTDGILYTIPAGQSVIVYAKDVGCSIIAWERDYHGAEARTPIAPKMEIRKASHRAGYCNSSI